MDLQSTKQTSIMFKVLSINYLSTCASLTHLYFLSCSYGIMPKSDIYCYGIFNSEKKCYRLTLEHAVHFLYLTVYCTPNPDLW